VGTKLQCEDPEAALGEWACGLARARSDLADRRARLQTGQLQYVVEDTLRRYRPGAVVRLLVLVEGQAIRVLSPINYRRLVDMVDEAWAAADEV
jgi:hypothetical protein